jgi:hypothetical protein
VRQDDDTPEPFEEGPTHLDAIPSEVMADEEVTDPVALTELPGFEVGWALGRRRALADAVEVLRLDLLKWGNDPGTAALVSQAFGRACGLRYV